MSNHQPPRSSVEDHQRAFSYASDLMRSHSFKWFCDVLDEERTKTLNRVVDMTDDAEIRAELAEVRVYDKIPKLLTQKLSFHKAEIEAQGGRTDGH